MSTPIAPWRELALDLLALIWPCECVVCRAPDRELCAACAAQLRRAEGRATQVVAPSGVGAFVAGPYAGPLRALLVAFKHGGQIGFGSVLGAQLRAPLRAALSQDDATAGVNEPVLVVTVASRPSRVRERGYRHVDLIVRSALRGRGLAGVPPATIFVKGALRATRGRTGQVGLSSAEREQNAARIAVPTRMRARVKGHKIVLVDDVITTGATVAAAVLALTAAGAEVIAVVALCATARRDSRFAIRETTTQNTPEIEWQPSGKQR